MDEKAHELQEIEAELLCQQGCLSPGVTVRLNSTSLRLEPPSPSRAELRATQSELNVLKCDESEWIRKLTAKEAELAAMRIEAAETIRELEADLAEVRAELTSELGETQAELLEAKDKMSTDANKLAKMEEALHLEVAERELLRKQLDRVNEQKQALLRQMRNPEAADVAATEMVAHKSCYRS